MLLFHSCVFHILVVSTRSLVSPQVENWLKWVNKSETLSVITRLKRQWQRQCHWNWMFCLPNFGIALAILLTFPSNKRHIRQRFKIKLNKCKIYLSEVALYTFAYVFCKHIGSNSATYGALFWNFAHLPVNYHLYNSENDGSQTTDTFSKITLFNRHSGPGGWWDETPLQFWIMALLNQFLFLKLYTEFYFNERSPIWNIQSSNKNKASTFFTDPHFTESFMIRRFTNLGSHLCTPLIREVPAKKQK